MDNEQFNKLFDYMVKVNDRLQHVEENMATKSDTDRIMNTIDSFIKDGENRTTDQLARDAQWERLIEWAHKVSEKTGIPLPNL